MVFFFFSPPPTDSTDDDKVVAWHWEEVKGPLREEKVSANTPVLTLNNLVPGNYTFKYTFMLPVIEKLVHPPPPKKKEKCQYSEPRLFSGS